MDRSLAAAAAACAVLLSLVACRPAAAPQLELPPAADATAAGSPASVAPQSVAVEPQLAQALNADIDRQGASAVLAALEEDSERFGRVGEAIASADPAWLTLALRLREGGEAAASQGLSMAAARALPEAPERVLALAGHGYGIGDLCTSPFIEAAPGVAEAYAAKTVAALQSVSDPALKATVDDCIKRVIVAKPGAAT